MLDYISQLPLPAEQIPQGLKDLLLTENNTNPQKEVIVTHRYEKNKYQKNYEYTQMLMAVVPEEDIANLTVLPESTDCVVAYSRPYCTQKGGVRGQKNSISGFGYIVASWGDGSHYSFFLAEDVWMKLGLTPRLTGDIEQRVIFDDASKPNFGVVKGDVSCKFFFESSKDIVWTMQNDYLRKYLWMKNCVGVKVFYYEAYITRTTEVKALLSGSNTYRFNPSWINLQITDHTDHVILQAWGTIQSVNPERCAKLDVNTLIWPGHASPMTRSRARDIKLDEYVFVDDSFLTKYEEDASYDAVPFLHGGHYHVNPSYGGQWSFSDCIRIGRNLVKMPFYELYRAVPDKEVAHVYDYAIDPSLIDDDLLKSEHIVSKTFRFANELFELNKNLVLLGDILDIPLSNADIFEYNHEEFQDEGIKNYPVLQKLCYVAPENMQEFGFLARCKTINEILNKIKLGSLKKLCVAMGVDKKSIAQLQTLKLLQGILTLCEAIADQNEDSSALKHANLFADFNARNIKVAPLFINNDLRNAEAHEAVGKSIQHLTNLGFESATLASGYSHALDFIFDKVIESLGYINFILIKALR